MKEALTYQDVALVPQYNNVHSRLEPSLMTWLTRTTQVANPFLPANMDTVISLEMAQVLNQNHMIPIFHRFAPIEEQMEWVRALEGNCYVSAGLGHWDQVVPLLDAGAIGVCIDIAHGHSDVMLENIQKYKRLAPTKEVIAGNVCTAMGYTDLVNAGADAVKVGVGPGSICITRMMTGFGVPQFTAVQECGEMAKRLRVPIIADGGIREPRDAMIALAAGASTVMMGGLFGKTLESAGETIEKDGKIWKHIRGQASKEFQEGFYGKMRKGTVEEGVSFDTPVSGSVQELIDKYCGALRSALTYGGARDIKEFQRKAEFVKVSSSYMNESKPAYHI